MTPYRRLWIVTGIIILSAVYAVVVKENPSLASAIASGYIALVLTAIIALNLWKKP